MRDIKFRIWKDMEMIFLSSALSNGDVFLMNGNSLMPDTEKIKIMQYTGLKDKNGVEVYESDILLVDELGVGFVEYTESYFSIFRPLTFSVNLCNYTSPAKLEPKNMVKVIGNIYENPELLKEPNEEYRNK